MEVLIDFHRAEPALLEFSAPPTMKYSHWKDCLPTEDLENQLMATGKLKEADVKAFNRIFRLALQLFHNRYCPESVTGQTLLGLGKNIQTTQEHLPITAKTSSQWFQAKHPLHEEAEQIAGLAFLLDGIISFLPLIHNHMFLDDAAACSSLDFSLRVFVPNVNINNWHLRENVSHVGAHGRTYSEARVWDESGNMVASMTQQSILRPHKATDSKL
jgi:Thioesterase-like superfamily